MLQSPASLSAVLANGELERRPGVPANEEAERRTVAALNEAVSGPAAMALQRVVEGARQLCDADSAGISVLEDSHGAPVFRWKAVAGTYASMQGIAMPGNCSPSATVLAAGGAQLMVRPARHYAPLGMLDPAIEEALLVPVTAHGRSAGTLWAVAHRPERRFTLEDRRVLARLARFAGIACGRLPGLARRLRPAAKRILVVDDGVDAAESLAMLLRVHGHSVEIAHDGVSALMKARRLRPDVVLLDIGLPSMDGYEVARRLRDELGRQLLIVAVTGWAGEEDRRKAVSAGFDHHLVKPVDPRFLVSLLG